MRSDVIDPSPSREYSRNSASRPHGLRRSGRVASPSSPYAIPRFARGNVNGSWLWNRAKASTSPTIPRQLEGITARRASVSVVGGRWHVGRPVHRGPRGRTPRHVGQPDLLGKLRCGGRARHRGPALHSASNGQRASAIVEAQRVRRCG